MGSYQTFRGNPENKLFYLLSNFIGGINTEFTDDNSADTSFENIINFNMDSMGTLEKRNGFGEIFAISEIFNMLDDDKLPTIKNRTPETPNPEYINDNIVYMKLLKNTNNCFRNLAGFSGEKAYREYQNRYGFQNNEFELMIITTSKALNKSTGWYYYCKLPELKYDADGNPTDEETLVINCYKTDFPVVFNWDRNLMNMDSIEYFDKIWFTNNNKALVCFDRSIEINSDSSFASAFTYNGVISGIKNNAYSPTGAELLIDGLGPNILCTNPLRDIGMSDFSGITTDSVQGAFITTTDNKFISDRIIPGSEPLLFSILYTGVDNGFSISAKCGDDEIELVTEVQSSLSTNAVKVYKIEFKNTPSGEVEFKVEKTGATLKPYYCYYTIGQLSPDLKPVQSLNIGEFNMCEMNGRAVYYNADTIYFSDVNIMNYVPANNYIVLPIEPTDKITKICYFKGVYIVFTKENIFKLKGNWGSSDFSREYVNTSIGCHAGNTVVAIEDTLYFASPRGIYALKSSTFVEGMQNLKELDLKVKKLTSDYTMFNEELGSPIRFNGISERAYALRYKDKYMLFYNNYDDKGDYAANNDLDTLVYQYELGAFTTYRFKEKPTFLFIVDNAIETFSTVAKKHIFTEEETIIDYDFDTNTGDQIIDRSGKGNNAEIVDNLLINKGDGVQFRNNAYGKISSFNGSDIEDGFDINIDMSCTELNGSAILSLKQLNSTQKPSYGNIETDTKDGYKLKLDYTIKPSNNKNTISYKLYLYRNVDTVTSGTVQYKLTGVFGTMIPEKTIEFDTTEYSSLIDSGSFTTPHIGNSYDDTYALNANIHTAKVIETNTRVYGKDYTISSSVFKASKEISWVKLGFTSFKATATTKGCKITYVAAVRNTARLNIGSRKLKTTFTVGNFSKPVTTTIPAISKSSGDTNGDKQTVELEYNGTNQKVNIKMVFAIKFTYLSKNKYYESISTSEWQQPIVDSYDVKTTDTQELNLDFEDIKSLTVPYTGESFREITVRASNEYLTIKLTSEAGERLVNFPTDGLDLNNRHVWDIKFAKMPIYPNLSQLFLLRDGITVRVATVDSAYVVNSVRDDCYLGTDSTQSNYFKGNIYSLNISNTDSILLNYDFSEGVSNIVKDKSSNKNQMTLNGDYSWLIIAGARFNGKEGYIQVPILSDDIFFTNGFKIEFSGRFDSLDSVMKVFDFATFYDYRNVINKYSSINFSLSKMLGTFSSYTSNNKYCSVEENILDVTNEHSYKIDVVDNGRGYTISLFIDDIKVNSDKFSYGIVENIKRTSNFIGKSNNPDDQLLSGVLHNFKLTIYASKSGVPLYENAIYEFDTTPTDFGRPIYIELVSKASNMKYPQHMKKLKHIFIKLIGGYQYEDVLFELFADGYLVNDPRTYDVEIDENGTLILDYTKEPNLSIDMKAGIVGNVITDKTKIGEGTYQVKKLVIPKKAKNFSIKMSGDTTNYVSVESIGFVCKLGKVKEN